MQTKLFTFSRFEKLLREAKEKFLTPPKRCKGEKVSKVEQTKFDTLTRIKELLTEAEQKSLPPAKKREEAERQAPN